MKRKGEDRYAGEEKQPQAHKRGFEETKYSQKWTRDPDVREEAGSNKMEKY